MNDLLVANYKLYMFNISLISYYCNFGFISYFY